MPRRLRDTLNGYPGGYSWTVPETSYPVAASNWTTLFDRVQKYYIRNNLPQGDLLDRIQSDLCARNPEYCYDAETELPGITTQLSSLGESFGRNLKHWLAGGEMTEDDIRAQERLKICEGCEFYRASDFRCGKCGCRMKVKTYLKAERCPVGKW